MKVQKAAHSLTPAASTPTHSMQEFIRNRQVCLAPVASVTNSVYRRICKRFGADYCVTELISSEGLTRDSLRSFELAHFTEEERPVAIQLFGGDAEKMGLAAELANELKPDVIDINMGCPARKVVRNSGGSSLLRDLPLLADIVSETVKKSAVPVSVKIRAGWDEENINAAEVARIIEGEGAQWITVHPRTRKQGFGGNARWEIIRDVRQSVKIPVIGNGDINSAEDALRMFDETGCHSIMIGRGCFGNPWIFEQVKMGLRGEPIRLPSVRERLEMALENLRMEIAEWRGDTSFAVVKMRKHLAWYISGVPGSKEIRQLVFNTRSYDEVHEILERFAALDAAESNESLSNLHLDKPTSCDPQMLDSSTL